MAQSEQFKPTACLALADGTVFYGHGFGATGETVAELCFNTAMTGYQEIMTDPSYAGQVVTFTFPHIGNTGTTAEDDETTSRGRRHDRQMGPDHTLQLADDPRADTVAGCKRAHRHGRG